MKYRLAGILLFVSLLKILTNSENAYIVVNNLQKYGGVMSDHRTRDIMRHPGVCLKANMSLDQVSDHLSRYHMSGAPVVDDEQHLVGFVSEYDCLERLMQSSYYCDNTVQVSDVMTEGTVTTTPVMPIIDLASEMNSNKVNVMPVVENAKVVGVVTRGDVMRSLVKNLDMCAVR